MTVRFPFGSISLFHLRLAATFPSFFFQEVRHDPVWKTFQPLLLKPFVALLDIKYLVSISECDKIAMHRSIS
jgi:hypothetical protein